MIDLLYVHGEAFVWNADDWLTLRREHRITGNLMGTLACLPRQDNFLGLPLILAPEEVRLLVDQGIARLVTCETLNKPPSEDLKTRFDTFRRQSYLDQVDYFMDEKKKKITDMVDIIIEGKKRKLMGLATTKKKGKKNDPQEGTSKATTVEIPDKDSVIEEEFKKIAPITEDAALVQIPTVSPWLQSSDMIPVDFPFPQTSKEILRSKIYSDLWSKGHYVTSGEKFGGDFLVYPGDPVKFHAQYIVLCRDSAQPLRALDLVAHSRLGTAVRKAIVFATIIEDEVRYHTVHYAG